MKSCLIFCIFFTPIFLNAQMILDQDNPEKVVVHAEDVVILGSLCVGVDCPNAPSFGFDTQRLMENNLRIHFDDTSNSSSFPNNDWRIVINDNSNGGANYFLIEDATNAKNPFRIEANAPSHSLYVESDGDIGFGTDNPVTEMHSKDGDTPTLRLEQDVSSGFTAQTWDLAGNEAGFFVRDVTNGSKLCFRIQPNAPDESLFLHTGELVVNEKGVDMDTRIESDANTAALFVDGMSGFVGVGTNAPAHNLHVVGDIGKTGQIVGVSDERVKSEVESIQNATSIIRQLDGKHFEYKGNEYPELGLPKGTQYGLIAQEVAAVLQDLVKTDFMKVENNEGKTEMLMGVKYEQLIPFLINAIKEQDRIINSQNILIGQLVEKAEANEERLTRLEKEVLPLKVEGDAQKSTATGKMD